MLAGRRDASFAEIDTLLTASPMHRVLTEYRLTLDEAEWEFTKRKQDHDPVPDLLGLRCPHLAMFGGADALVPVVDSVEIFTAAACRPGRDPRHHFTARVFPGGDHRVRVDGEPAPGYLPALSGWISSVLPAA